MRCMSTMAVAGVVAACLVAAVGGQAPQEQRKTEARPAATLDDVVGGRARIVDLCWPINDTSPYWPGENYTPFQLRTIATLQRDGVLSKAFSMPEHLGTHLDAPNHFEADQPSVDELRPEDLFAEGVVIDIRAAAAQDADYRLTVADLENWEAEHGRIPQRAVVLLCTGWGRFWQQTPRYQNRDVQGRMHFPAYSAEAARWLIDKRDARGLGIDTLSIDYGLSREFAVHHVVNAAGRYGLENVAQLQTLPPRGFYVVVAPIKIESGTGGPARIFAIVP